MWQDLTINIDTEGCTVATYWEGAPARLTRVSVADAEPESPLASARAARVVCRVLDAYDVAGYTLAWEAGEHGESVARVAPSERRRASMAQAYQRGWNDRIGGLMTHGLYFVDVADRLRRNWGGGGEVLHAAEQEVAREYVRGWADASAKINALALSSPVAGGAS